MTDTINTDDGQAASDAADTAALESAAAQLITGGELSGPMGDVVRKAVSAQYAAAAKEIAAKAVGELLTPDVRAQMAEAAVAEAHAALAPPIEVPEFEDDEDEGESEEHEEDGADEEDKPQRCYSTVEAFVEKYVSEVYRRETTERNVESRRRWCPQWWRHGEARARFDALWDAFEDARQGETGEMSLFWLVHLDPHMSKLFDPDGPFKYCSPNAGHNEHLHALPVVPAPPDYSSSDVTSGTVEPEHFAGLVIPNVPTRRRVVIPNTFP